MEIKINLFWKSFRWINSLDKAPVLWTAFLRKILNWRLKGSLLLIVILSTFSSLLLLKMKLLKINVSFSVFSAGFYKLKVNNKSTRTRCELRRQWRRSGVFVVNFELFKPCSCVSIVDFDHVIAKEVLTKAPKVTFISIFNHMIFFKTFRKYCHGHNYWNAKRIRDKKKEIIDAAVE